MNKLLLEKYVKVAVKKALKEQEQLEKKAEKAMYLIYRFPKLKELMEDLLSPAFGRFISSIRIIAPKPTVFNVELINGQEFDITYIGNSKFRIRVSGKKYYPANIGELERASQSIADLLILIKPNPNIENEKQQEFDSGLANDLKADGGSGGSFSGGNFNEPQTTDGNNEFPENTPEEDEKLLAQSKQQNPEL